MAITSLPDSYFDSIDDGFFNDDLPSSPLKPLPTKATSIPPLKSEEKATIKKELQQAESKKFLDVNKVASSNNNNNKVNIFSDVKGKGSTSTVNSGNAKASSSNVGNVGSPIKKLRIDGILSPKKIKTTNSNLPLAKRVVARVGIKIEDKENWDFILDPKGKGKEKEKVIVKAKAQIIKAEEIDFDALLDGMDWVEDDLILSPEISVASPDEKETVIPESKRYLRCEVEAITTSTKLNRQEKTLHVKTTNLSGTFQILLRDDWFDTPVEVGNIVNLIGPFSASETPSLIIDRLSNLLILHPDILVSSTKVADSSSCARKAVLQELIRTTGPSNPSLTYGNLLHELMQTSLTEESWEEDTRKEKIQDMLERDVQTLWTMESMTVDKALEELNNRSREFSDFAETFVGDVPKAHAIIQDSRTKSNDQARLAITKTLAVEEDIWSPKYGLKGKIDVSISGRIDQNDVEGESRPLPFEIKTGKSNAGMEHRAQTMLYTLLMSDRYDEVIDTGLLYYSQSNQIFRVQAARNEIRSLLITRNQFATYLHRRMHLSRTSDRPKKYKKKQEEEDEFDEYFTPETEVEQPLLMPEPIDSERDCKWCYASDACMLFRKAVDGDNEISLDDTDPLQIMYEDKTGHLKEAHTAFFRKWESLISFEEQEQVRFKKEIWTMGADERMRHGRCLANMSIDETYVPPPQANTQRIHSFTYRLQLAQPVTTQATSSQRAERSLLSGNIGLGDPIVVSLEQPSVLSISRGFVVGITQYHVTVGLDHTLTDIGQATRAFPQLAASELVFRIDKDELAAGMGRIRDNLIQLFVPGGDERRRRSIVDNEAPTFMELNQDEADIIPSNLNSDQRLAVEKVLSANDYSLIMGMPGTGKTTTIAEILKALVKAGKKVLLTSYTHSAVDNILLKVKDSGLNILRLGNRDKIMPALHHFTLSPENRATTPEQLHLQLMTPDIVATTCLSINEPIFTRRRFDVCIVDEASQVTLPTCLGPLRYAETFVLVGDHNQLRPLVRNPAARTGGLEESLFKILAEAHPEALVDLTLQYRMNDDIMLLSNRLVYNGRLQSGSEAVSAQRLQLSKPEALNDLHRGEKGHEGPCWIKDLLDPERSVIFVNTDSLPARENRSDAIVENRIEADLVFQISAALVHCGVPEEDIGIIALYRQQIKIIAAKLANYPGIEVLTADKSQGRDKECIIMSLTRSNTTGTVGDLLKDWRRINVCLTRAKSKLIVFGSRSTLKNVEVLQQFFDLIDEKSWLYTLPIKSNEFHQDYLKAYSPKPISRKREGDGDLEIEIKGEEIKKFRMGGGSLTVKKPLSRDILNCI